VAEIGQGTLDPVVSPVRIFFCEAYHKFRTPDLDGCQLRKTREFHCPGIPPPENEVTPCFQLSVSSSQSLSVESLYAAVVADALDSLGYGVGSKNSNEPFATVFSAVAGGYPR